MGTRGLFGFRINGQDKLTYNHYDSYPEGLGSDLVQAIDNALEDGGLESLKAKAAALEVIDDSIPPTAEQKERLAPYANLNVSNRSLDDWYCLTRELQGNITSTLEAGVILDGHDFINDSLFCEWGYIVNLDDDLFEVYRGFQKEAHTNGRYASSTPDKSGYYPCALVATFPLVEIPEDWIKSVEH